MPASFPSDIFDHNKIKKLFALSICISFHLITKTPKLEVVFIGI